MKIKRLVLGLGLLFIFSFSLAQTITADEELYPAEELKEDFWQMRKLLEDNHADLYEYTNKETFDKLFNEQFKLIDQPMKLHEFFKILTPITSKIGCGHTNVWMPGKYWDSNPLKLFPLKIEIMQGYPVVTGNYNNDLEIPTGSIILEINNRPFTDIYEEMEQNYSADAFNENFIRTQIARRFSLIYARRFGFPEKLNVTYAPPGRKTSETKMVEPADIEDVRATVFSNFHHPELEFEIQKDKDVAVMTIKTFIYYDRVPMFKEFLENSFSQLKEKKVNNLILDLQGNDGGDPFCSAPLFSYLISQPAAYYAEVYPKYEELAKPIKPADNGFNGNLFILIDGRCFSTNGHFCSLLKYHKIGTFVGSEGGATYKCNAGKNTQFTLANTEIMLYLGRSTYTAAVKNMNKAEGVKPDYAVEQNYKDFLNGIDTVMEYTYRLMKK
jgi:hypothetical protein